MHNAIHWGQRESRQWSLAGHPLHPPPLTSAGPAALSRLLSIGCQCPHIWLLPLLATGLLQRRRRAAHVLRPVPSSGCSAVAVGISFAGAAPTSGVRRLVAPGASGLVLGRVPGRPPP